MTVLISGFTILGLILCFMSTCGMDYHDDLRKETFYLSGIILVMCLCIGSYKFWLS